MGGRTVIGDGFIIIGLMVIVAAALHLFGVPQEEKTRIVGYLMPVLIFMFSMSTIELIAQLLLREKSLGPAALLLKITSFYRSIGALLPIPYLGKLYMANLNRLTEVYCQQLKFDEAVRCTEKQIAIARSRYGEESPEMAEGLINLSSIYSLSDKPQLAAEFGEKGMKIFDNATQMSVREKQNISMIMNNLGSAYANSGKTGPALELLTRSLRLKEQLVGADHPSYGLSLGNIGYTFLCAKEYTHAEKYLRMANNIAQSEKLVTATMKNNFGEALRGVSKLDEAERLLQEALSMRESCLPAKHPHFGYSYHNLGKLYANKGDRERAEKFFKMAIELRGTSAPGSKLLKETKEDYQKFLDGEKFEAETTPPTSAAKPEEQSAKIELSPKTMENPSKIDLSEKTEDISVNK